MLVRGSLAGRDDLTFVVDSGLFDERGAAYAAPASTLAATGIAVPETAPETGRPAPARSGSSSAAPRSRGSPSGRSCSTTSSACTARCRPRCHTRPGSPVHGLISHGCLRRYRWTIDFARMTMGFG
jgi:hypothetical protein